MLDGQVARRTAGFGRYRCATQRIEAMSRSPSLPDVLRRWHAHGHELLRNGRMQHEGGVEIGLPRFHLHGDGGRLDDLGGCVADDVQFNRSLWKTRSRNARSPSPSTPDPLDIRARWPKREPAG